jgi:hypothetical protein
MDSQLQSTIPMVYGLKILKLGSVFVAANISANYMSQVYMEKVLVNQENPQPLINLVYMYGLVDLTFTLFLLALTYAIGMFVKNDNSKIMELLTFDLTIGLGFVIVLSSIVASTMHNKKFFMYKDDGLRAIRGLKDIVIRFGMVFAMIPFFLFNNR